MIPCWYEYYFLAFQEFPQFMKHEGWQGSHQFLLSVWCLQSTLLSLQCYLNFLVYLLPPRRLTKVLYAFYFSPLHLTFPAHHIILVSITLMIFRGEKKPWKFSLCGFPILLLFLLKYSHQLTTLELLAECAVPVMLISVLKCI